MKLKNNLSSYEINRLLSDAWLNVNVDDSELWNPLSEIPPSLEDDPQLYITWLMMQPEYMSFVCSQIFNIEIFPLQGVILSQLWQHKFPMLIASRGASKCLSKNTIVMTDGGINRISDFIDETHIEQYRYHTGFKIFGENGFKYSDYIFYNGLKPTIKIESNMGFELEGTYNHPIRILRDKSIIWEKLENIKLNDNIIIDRTETWFTNASNKIEIDEAYLLGLLVGDGGYTQKNRISFTTSDKELSDAICRLSLKYFGKTFKQVSKYGWNLNSKEVWLKLFDYYEFNSAVCGLKAFPGTVLKSTKETMKAFIQGIMDTDGCVTKRGSIGFCAKSPSMAKMLHFILTKFGIVSRVKPRLNKTYNRYYYHLTISGCAAKKYINEIGFRLTRKINRCKKIIENKSNTNLDVIPNTFILDKIIKLVKKYIINKDRKYWHEHRHLAKARLKCYGISYYTLDKIINSLKNDCYTDISNDPDYLFLIDIYNKNYYYDKVTKIEAGENHTFDFHVPNDHSFISNAMISHNSSSLAIYSLLRMLLLPGRKIILCGAGFRQSKLIFDYMENIWNNSPLLRDMCRGPQQGPQHGTDVWSFRIGESVTKAIPIGCLSEDSLVTTSDGIVSLKDLQNTKTKIWGNSKYRDIGFFYDSGIVPSIKVKTKKGYEYIGTPNHKMKIVRDNSIKWIRTDEMKIGDKIIIDRTNRWHNGDSDASIDDAYCLGVMIGDGNYTNKYYLRYTTIDEDTFIPILNKTIGVFKKQKDHHYQLNGKDKVHEWLDFWGMQHTYTKDKSLPKKILCSNKEKMTACLQGLFDTDGSIQSVKSKDGVSLRISFTNTSKKLIEQIHYILLHYGIISTLTYRDRLSPRTGNPALRCYDLYINGENAYKFYKNIGFRMKRKSDALLNAINNKTRFNSIEDEIAGTFDFFKQNYPIMVKNNIKPTFHKLRKFNILNKNLPNSILELCNENHYYDEIKEIEKSIDRPMYDINVPDGNEYCANGFFSHNTGEKIRGQRANDIICVSKDTLIQTDKGLVEIKDYIDGNEYKVMNDIYKFEYPSHIMITKPTDVYKITTIGGYTLKCSEFHQVMTTNGWKKGCELTKDDYVYIDSNDFFPENYYKYQDIILNENLAWTMGVMIAEGHIAKRNEISITNTDYSLIERLKNQNTWSWHEYYRPQYKDKRGFNCKESWTLKYTCTEFREKLYKMGLDYTVHKDKKIPKCILQSPKSVVLSFLSGLFEGDGTAFTDSNNHIYMAYYSTSYNLCHQIQTLLLKFGIYSSLNKRTSNLSDKDQWILRVNGENGYNLYKLLNIKKWNLDTSKISYRTKKSSITEKKYKNKTKYILSTWLGNKNIYIGTYNSKQQCDESFEEFWKTQRKAIRIKSIEKLQDKEALYDFHMPESHSFIGNGFVNHNCDEFDAINRDIFETVIAGFAAVSSNPIDAMKHEARKKLAKEIGFQLPKQQKDEVDKPNQIIISGTAGYEFNHFCQYWRKWKQFILSNGDEKELNQLFNGKVPIDFDHKDYCILRLPIELIPRGFMDPAQIARSKATLHSGIFQMEFSAVFSKDSSGFFKRSLIESCTASPDNSIVINGSSIVYGPKVRGDKKARYVFGVDPASEVDKFSIVILEVYPSHRRIVYCWTTNKKEHRERIRAGITKETDFYSFCARKIRDLMKVFPCERIAIDAQGGGYPIIECLHNKNLIEYDEKPLWPIINPDKSQDSDGEYGDHIINVIQFTDYKWTSEANHSLRLDFESKKCLFPYKDTMDVAIAMGEKELSENLYDTLEDCIFDIEELKNELSYIVITKTNSGRDRWDTPEMKLPGNKKGRLRKDRYSALVMANMIARNLEADSGPINYDTQADWSRKGPKDDNGPKMIGPQWAIDSLGNLYD